MKWLRNLPILAWLARKLFGRGRSRKRLRKVGMLPKIEQAEAQAAATYPEYSAWAERVQAEAERNA